MLCRWVGKLAHFLYFTSLVVYVCSISYFVWVVVHSARIATAPKLIAFLELVSYRAGLTALMKFLLVIFNRSDWS